MCQTYEEFISTQWYLPFGTSNRHFVARLLGAGEDDLAIPLLLEFVDLGQAGDKLTVVQSINVNDLGHEFRVLSRELE